MVTRPLLFRSFVAEWHASDLFARHVPEEGRANSLVAHDARDDVLMLWLLLHRWIHAGQPFKRLVEDPAFPHRAFNKALVITTPQVRLFQHIRSVQGSAPQFFGNSIPDNARELAMAASGMIRGRRVVPVRSTAQTQGPEEEVEEEEEGGGGD